ncbi:MAG: tRNA (guanosine(37)-N1)-methyltransferase TrmD, partial [Oscillospiraceae bacterium]
DKACYEEESHFNGLLEYPQYTRPEEWRGRKVPPVLLSGHDKNIQDFRKEQSYLRTLKKRPDMIEKLEKQKGKGENNEI